MDITLLRRARQHFVHDMAPRHIQRANIRKWIHSIDMLGDKWIMRRVIVSPERLAKREGEALFNGRKEICNSY